jgi:rhamnulokinase
MKGVPRFLAFDLGAESGRAIVGTLEQGRLTLEEIHRFPNEPVEVCGTLYWDVLALYRHVLEGMRSYVQRFGDTVQGIGLDTWGVDFGLLDRDGHLLQNPVHYRDRRTAGMVEAVTARMPADQLFRRTGMALLPIQTLCQLLSLRSRPHSILDQAATLLMMPDLLGYFLTGVPRCERTIAVTTQLYNLRTAEWDDDLCAAFDLPRSLLPPLIPPGTELGPLQAAVARSTGLRGARVLVPCTHDTAAAVAAVPGEGEDWLFLSSGTWSILGVLIDEPVTDERARARGLCNELTLGRFFLGKNLMGLWLLQQVRREWVRQGQPCSYSELMEWAEQAPPGGPLVEVNHPSFLAPESMTEALAEFCRQTGQAPPQDPPETVRCILASLALAYRQAAEELAEVTGRKWRVLHLVGGGALNRPLCQMTAEALGLPVEAGPVQATAAGNVLGQALGAGMLSSPEELRSIVRRSLARTRYQPTATRPWEMEYRRYRERICRSHG